MPLDSLDTSIRLTIFEPYAFLQSELSDYFKQNGYQVQQVNTANELTNIQNQYASHVYLLDLPVTEQSHLNLVKNLANPDSHAIILLTGKIDLADKLQSLEYGADLCLNRPVQLAEINAYVKSLYRRLPSTDKTETWVLNLTSRRLNSSLGKSLSFTVQEIKALEILLTEPGKIISRSEIGDYLGITNPASQDHRINTIMFRLRQKLARLKTDFEIQSWRGDGYSITGPSLLIED